MSACDGYKCDGCGYHHDGEPYVRFANGDELCGEMCLALRLVQREPPMLRFTEQCMDKRRWLRAFQNQVDAQQEAAALTAPPPAAGEGAGGGA